MVTKGYCFASKQETKSIWSNTYSLAVCVSQPFEQVCWSNFEKGFTSIWSLDFNINSLRTDCKSVSPNSALMSAHELLEQHPDCNETVRNLVHCLLYLIAASHWTRGFCIDGTIQRQVPVNCRSISCRNPHILPGVPELQTAGGSKESREISRNQQLSEWSMKINVVGNNNSREVPLYCRATPVAWEMA